MKKRLLFFKLNLINLFIYFISVWCQESLLWNFGEKQNKQQQTWTKMNHPTLLLVEGNKNELGNLHYHLTDDLDWSMHGSNSFYLKKWCQHQGGCCPFVTKHLWYTKWFPPLKNCLQIHQNKLFIAIWTLIHNVCGYG